MSYLKLPKTCSDHAVGLQSVNQALDNNQALYETQFDPGHRTNLGVTLGGWPLPPGRHDDVLVARTAADFSIATIAGLGVTAVALVGGPVIVDFPDRLQAGQWRVRILTPRIFSAVATVKGATTGGSRYATTHVSGDSLGPYVTVSTWNVTGGTLDDYDFSLVIWAEGVG